MNLMMWTMSGLGLLLDVFKYSGDWFWKAALEGWYSLFSAFAATLHWFYESSFTYSSSIFLFFLLLIVLLLPYYRSKIEGTLIILWSTGHLIFISLVSAFLLYKPGDQHCGPLFSSFWDFRCSCIFQQPAPTLILNHYILF